MKNEVTVYGIFEALRTTDATGLSEKGIANAANIDTSSENLLEIREHLFDANHPYYEAGGKRFWGSI